MQSISTKLTELSQFFDTEDLSIRLVAKNLETVYVRIVDSRYVITDLGETFQYIEANRDEYSRVEELGADRLKSICADCNVTLNWTNDDGIEYFSLITQVDSDPELNPAITRMSSCIGAIFSTAHALRGT